MLKLDTEGYRSGHNGAVLKTVRAKVHAGSNPAPSATSELISLCSKTAVSQERLFFHPGFIALPLKLKATFIGFEFVFYFYDKSLTGFMKYALRVKYGFAM